MELFRGYVLTRNKQCMEKFKGVKRLKTLDDVRDAEEFAGILGDETILIDVDDGPTSDLLFQMVQDLRLKCRVYGTTRGKHFYFRNPEGAVEKSWTKQTLAVGITTDAKVGRNNSYAIMRFNGVDRPVLLDCPESEIQVVPKWLTPVKTNQDFLTMEAGDGRNTALYTYILTLQSEDFTKEEARECIRLINRYVLPDPLDSRELETILRDDAFKKPVFFKDKTFLHDKFGTFMKNNNHIVKINGQLHIYKDGIYIPGSMPLEAAMIKHIPNLKRAQRSEVLAYLQIAIEEELKPTNPALIAFSNGLYDLRDDTFHSFTPNVVITNKIPWPYNPAAYSELLDHTLDRLACNDPEVRALLEEMVGYCLYRRNELGKAFILIGDKSNGKSTFLYVVNQLLGDTNIASLDLKELGDRFKTAELYGKLANLGDDISADYVSNVSIFKKLVTGERVNVERKGSDPFEFNSYCKFVFSANDVPRMGGGKDSKALKRRFIIIPFNATFTKESDADFNRDIKRELREQEHTEYSLLVALRGLHRLLEANDYTASEKVDEQLKEYEISNNSIAAFVEECKENDFAGDCRIINEPCTNVYRHYEEFCIRNGLNNRFSRNEFGKQLCKLLSIRAKAPRLKEEGGKVCKVYEKVVTASE